MSDKISIIFIPQKTSRVFRLQVSTKYLKYLKYLGVFLVLVTAYVVVQYLLYANNVRKYNQLIEEKRLQNLVFNHILESTQLNTKVLNDISRIYERLRTLVTSSDKENPANQNLNNGFNANLPSLQADDALSASINREIQNYKASSTILSDSLLSMKKIFLNQNERLRATPFIKPVKAGILTSGFGPRSDPFTGEAHMHYGIDWAFLPFTPVFSTADGIVEKAYRSLTYGNTVIINHRYGFKTLYAHLAKIEVEQGKPVRRGQLVGRMGSTGTRSTATHLHYEIIVNGKQEDPRKYILEALPEANTFYSTEY